MDGRTKLKGVFTRFIAWSKEMKEKYEEMSDLFESFLQTQTFELFVIGIQSSKEFEPIKNICKQADEEEVCKNLRNYIDTIVEEMDIETKFEEKDILRLIKYLRLFGDVANNGV
jgi:predicted RNA-binding protein Jag